jgi:hypothetical protein
MTEVSNDIEKGVESMTTTKKAEDVVNPWEVASSSEKGVDYDKLISKSRPFRLLRYKCTLSSLIVSKITATEKKDYITGTN